MSIYGNKNMTKGSPTMTRKEKSILAGIWGTSLVVALGVLFYAQVAFNGTNTNVVAKTPTKPANQTEVAVETVETEGVTASRAHLEEKQYMEGGPEEDVMTPGENVPFYGATFGDDDVILPPVK